MLFVSALARPLSLRGFLGGLLTGAAGLWTLTAAWIELAPASVLSIEYGIGRASQAALDRCDFNDVLVLGDSKIMVALDRVTMSVPVLNIAEGSGNPAIDVYRTKSIPQCPHLPKLVVLSYSPLNVRRLAPFVIHNFLINRLLPQTELRELADRLVAEDGGSSLAERSIDDVPAVVKFFGNVPFHVQALLYKADFPPLYQASMQASFRTGFLRRWQENEWVGEDVRHPLGHDDWRSRGATENDTIFTDAAMNDVPRSHAIERDYRRLVDRFTALGIPVLIAPIPVNEPTFQAIPQAVRDEYAAFLHSLAAGRDNVTVLEPIWAVWPAKSFGDRWGHVNRVGQAEITRLIDRCIASLLHPPDIHRPKDCTMDHDAL